MARDCLQVARSLASVGRFTGCTLVRGSCGSELDGLVTVLPSCPTRRIRTTPPQVAPTVWVVDDSPADGSSKPQDEIVGRAYVQGSAGAHDRRNLVAVKPVVRMALVWIWPPTFGRRAMSAPVLALHGDPTSVSTVLPGWWPAWCTRWAWRSARRLRPGVVLVEEHGEWRLRYVRDVDG